MAKLLLLILLVISIAVNVYFFAHPRINNDSKNSFAEEEKKYPLLSKRILQDFPQDLLINFLPLRSKLKDITKDYKDTLALYFEYLPTGTSIGINEKEEFFAASLFKLPVVMAYLHQKERLKKEDDPVVTIAPNQLDDRFGDLWTKGAGYKIGLGEAVKLALTQSDNTAARLLGPFIDEKDFSEIYEGLDIDLRLSDKGAVLTTKNYSSILKALYFSAVLSKEHSQQILEYLNESKFDDKLAVGIPKDIAFAHKIGVVNDESFMDCGIVYPKRRTYLLCVVSKSSEEIARNRMSLISKTVYDYLINVATN